MRFTAAARIAPSEGLDGAARLWRRLVVAELGLAAAVGATAAARGAALGVVAIAALVCLLALQIAWVIGSFALGRGSARIPAGAPVRRARLAQACARECLAFPLAAFAMAIEPYRRAAAVPPVRAGACSRPALLVHGFACNAAIWRPLVSRLRRAGYGPVRTATLSPVCADLDSHATTLARTLLTMAAECSGERITVIAHSMGGLVARAALQALGPRIIRRIVTLATPHHGTTLAAAAARALPCIALDQMSPGSAWLDALNGAAQPDTAVPIACVFSLEDDVIAPPASATLAGARTLEVPGQGHFSLLRSRAARRFVLEALAEP
ncbi:MAG TPA: alpha/beta fold hydrolase [Steroidobacteraceae bacterium]|nr:alpha/beta fold hydrolase [Steroidobacteraceae bacterium]